MMDSPEHDHYSGTVDESENPMMQSIAESAARGVGRDNSGPVCYRSVKKIIADGLGRNLNCVRGIVYGGEAVDAAKVLPKAGFRDDRSKCNAKGVIRVYKGYLTGTGKKGKLAGDTAGHIEVLGSDGNFHSFYENPTPIDHDMKGRRILIGCFVPDVRRIESGALGKCPKANKSQGTKKRASKKKGST